MGSWLKLVKVYSSELKLAEEHQHHWRWQFQINFYKIGGKLSPYFSWFLLLFYYTEAPCHLP